MVQCTTKSLKAIIAQRRGSQGKPKRKSKKTSRSICWDAFSVMIRMKYADECGRVKCYTCESQGNWEGDGFQAGHLVPGRGNSVYVNQDVVRVQCSQCNMWNGGEQYKFGKRMELEVGAEKVAEFMKLKGQTVQYGKKDWERMTGAFIYASMIYADEKGLTMPTWTKKYLINL